MARKLIVEIIGDSTKLTRSFNQSTTAANKFGAEVSGSMGKAEKSFTKLQRVAAGGFVGAAALSAGIVALRKVVDAAAESEQVLGQTQVALESTGKSWSEYGARIESAVAQQSRLGFDDEALFRTFSLFVRQSDSVTEALRRNRIAMDLSRARFIDLEQAAALVNKAALGQAGALRRVGIDAKTGATGIQLLAQLEREFGGAAARASGTATAAQQRFQVSVENLQEEIGKGLLPIVSELAGALSDTADATGTLIGRLGELGNVKIPAINIPLNFDVPGTGGDSVAKTWFKRLSPAGIVFNTADLLKLIADQVTPDKSRVSHESARIFDDAFVSFTEALEDGYDQAITKANKRLKSFGEKGFKAMKVNEFGESLQRSFEAALEALDLKLDQATFAENTTGALAILAQTEAAIRERIKTEGRTTELLRLLFQVEQDRAGVIADDKAARKADADKIAQDRKEAAAALIDALEFGVTEAQLTPFLKDDLAAMRVLEKGLKKQISAGTNVVENQRRLTVLEDQIADAEKERTKNLKKAADAAAARQQFRRLGVGPGGEEFVPGIKNLRKQFKQLSDNPELVNVPKKLRDRLALVGKELARSGKNLKPEVAKWINDVFGTIRGTLDTETKKPLPRHVQLSDKILTALGFDQDIDTKKLQKFQATTARLQPRVTTPTAAAGVGGVNITGPITVVADDPDAFLRDLQKKAARTTATARGRFPGRSLGLG